MKNSVFTLFVLLSMFTLTRVKADNVNLYDEIKSKADKTTVINFNENSAAKQTNNIYVTSNTDSGKEVYYFRGDADKLNNNILFNNMCWKIIRTTETGGIKLIFNGTPTNGKCTIQTGSGTQIGTSKYNSISNDNAYVGYMYGTSASDNYKDTHKNINNSSIKIYIDNWYKTNFIDKVITSRIDDTVFCNDRSMVSGGVNNTLLNTSYGTLGYGTNATGYSSLSRVSFYSSTPSPSLKCIYKNDKFTVSTDNGNGELDYPVGLITLDEVVFAGFNTNASNSSSYKNTTNYLYTNKTFWTITPVTFHTNGFARIGYIYNSGYIGDNTASSSNGVRPVISLKNGTLVTGEGSTTDPYQVVPMYSVSFETNSNTKLEDITLIGNGSKVTKPKVLEKTGYTFNGWYSDSDFINKYDFDSIVTDFLTLYAKWTPNKYTLSFETNGGNSIENMEITYDSEYGNLGIPEKNGYTFDGWYYDILLTNKWNSNDKVDGDKTLYAKWVKNYTYKFIKENDQDILGDEQTFVVSNVDKYTFTIDGDFSLFDKLSINNLDLVKNVDYTVKEGSTIITFTESGLSKLNTLSVGSYDVKIDYTNGKEVIGKLNIIENSSAKTEEVNPKTYDGIVMWIVLGIISIVGICLLIVLRKKKYVLKRKIK